MEQKLCKYCQEVLERKSNTTKSAWQMKQYCSKKCSGRARYYRFKNDIRIKAKQYRKDNVEIIRLQERESKSKSRYKLKLDILKHYGAYCFCCNETTIEFLSIDHIDGNGNKHRKDNNIKGGVWLYKWLIDNNYPSGFQILCHNCNQGRYINGGICPHVC